MQRARVLVSWTLAVFAVATTATPSSAAASTPYTASFSQERTVQRTCPPGVPLGSFCFTGSDHSGTGASNPPIPTDIRATEDFAGFVDFTSPIADACAPKPGSTQRTPGFPDHNVVAIGTYAGRLFLTTDGVDCMSTGTDDGVWHAVGGTGIFKGARGMGTVHTQATGGTGSASDPIRSFSTYTGTLTLR